MAVSPFIFLGMTYCVQDFSIKENGIFFKGYTILPSTLPGVLSSMKIAVKDFFISFDGSIYEVDIKTEGKYSIPLEDWTLTFENIGVEAKNGSFELVLGSCGLIFPYDFNVQAVEVEDVRYDLIQKRFVFEEIKAKTDFSMELSGIKLTLKEVEVSGDWTFGFRGDATFDENFPEFLRNCTTSAYISFGPTDGIKDLSIEAKGLSGKISEDNKILILKDGEILVEKQTKNSVTVSIKGGLYFTEQAPVGMQDVKLEIEEFSYDGGTNEILNLSAKASGFKFAIGQVQFDNIFAEVKIGKEETNEKFVNLGGSMILPQAMSDVIAASSEQRIDIETFKLYFDGRMDFDAIYTMQGPVEAFDSIILSNIYAEAIYESNSFTFVTRAHMDLSEDKFPEGIGGISTDVDFVFSENGIESAYAYCNLKSGSQIFNTFTVNNAYLEMKKSDVSGEINFAIGGSLRLPGEEKMPQGIANAVISIDAFKINSRGELLEFEAGIVLSDVIVYNAVKLKSRKRER